MTPDLSILEQKNLSLEELIKRFPKEWQKIENDICIVIASRQPQNINHFMLKTKATADLWRQRLKTSQGNPKVYKTAASYIIRAKLTYLALDIYFQALLAKKDQAGAPELRGLFDRLYAKRFFFGPKSKEKPLNHRLAALGWRLVAGKGELLGKACDLGIYCLYTDRFIHALAQFIGKEPALEIGAGDGRLSRFLTAAGCNLIATDNYSWGHHIAYPSAVENLDASLALQKYKPATVLCCWPPAPNKFEQQVFKCESVKRYLVIGSHNSFATGDRKAYDECGPFDRSTELKLTQLIFPPELEGEVYLFQRP